MQQLEINGIGQQKATLTDWKKENNIYTHKLNDETLDHDVQWSCWDEFKCVEEFASDYGYDAIALGKTEKQAILKFCHDNEIKPPFWW